MHDDEVLKLKGEPPLKHNMAMWGSLYVIPDEVFEKSFVCWRKPLNSPRLATVLFNPHISDNQNKEGGGGMGGGSILSLLPFV